MMPCVRSRLAVKDSRAIFYSRSDVAITPFDGSDVDAADLVIDHLPSGANEQCVRHFPLPVRVKRIDQAFAVRRAENQVPIGGVLAGQKTQHALFFIGLVDRDGIRTRNRESDRSG